MANHCIMANQGRKLESTIGQNCTSWNIWTQDQKYEWTQWTQDQYTWTQWTQYQYDGSWNISSIAGMYKAKLKDPK